MWLSGDPGDENDNAPVEAEAQRWVDATTADIDAAFARLLSLPAARRKSEGDDQGA
jgi:hypothetical protein